MRGQGDAFTLAGAQGRGDRVRFPWQRTERREAAGGSYTAILSQLISAQAAGQVASASATAAMEAAAGFLSRAFASAHVRGAEWLRGTISPVVLAQIGRDLIRVGESLHVIRMTHDGMPLLVPSSTWYWQGSDPDPESWHCTATAYAPTGSATWRVPFESVVFATWGNPTARPYHGLGPASWAATTARLHAEAEKALADESAGPLAQIIPVPGAGATTDANDPLAKLRADINASRGQAFITETTAAGWGEGMSEAPRRDWKAERMGPDAPAAMVELAQQSFERVLAATGTPPALFTGDADGTAQREAIRRWHMNVVLPLARMLETELSRKLESPVKLEFDGYPKDLVSRAQVFSKLAAAEGMTVSQALELAGFVEEIES